MVGLTKCIESRAIFAHGLDVHVKKISEIRQDFHPEERATIY